MVSVCSWFVASITKHHWRGWCGPETWSGWAPIEFSGFLAPVFLITLHTRKFQAEPAASFFRRSVAFPNLKCRVREYYYLHPQPENKTQQSEFGQQTDCLFKILGHIICTSLDVFPSQGIQRQQYLQGGITDAFAKFLQFIGSCKWWYRESQSYGHKLSQL